MDIEDCLRKGYLVKTRIEWDLIEKEVKESQYDLRSAKQALEEKNHKWTIIQCYYAMFHIGKAVCFRQGYREKKHVAVLIMLEHLNKQGKVEGRFVNDFRAVMAAREGADYQYTYSPERAEQVWNLAQEFVSKLQQFIHEKGKE